MTVRAVEGQKLWTGWTAITVDQLNKTISLNLRDENNLIEYDVGDDEIYVDLQLGDEIRPTSDFPVWVTVGRAITDNGWWMTGTILVAKTTSGDNIKLFYCDDWKLYIDNGTWTFKQIYLKSEVDALLALKQDKLTAGDNITIDENNVISATGGSHPVVPLTFGIVPSSSRAALSWWLLPDDLEIEDLEEMDDVVLAFDSTDYGSSGVRLSWDWILTIYKTTSNYIEAAAFPMEKDWVVTDHQAVWLLKKLPDESFIFFPWWGFEKYQMNIV